MLYTSDTIAAINKAMKEIAPNITVQSTYNGISVTKEIKNLIITSSKNAAAVRSVNVMMEYHESDNETWVFRGDSHGYSTTIQVSPRFPHQHLSGKNLCIGPIGYDIIRKRVDLSDPKAAATTLARNFEPVEAVLANPERESSFLSPKYRQLRSLPSQTPLPVEPFKWNGTPWYHLKKPQLQELESTMVQALTTRRRLTVTAAKQMVGVVWERRYPGMDTTKLPNWLFVHVANRHNQALGDNTTATGGITVSPGPQVNRTARPSITLGTVQDNELFITISN